MKAQTGFGDLSEVTKLLGPAWNSYSSHHCLLHMNLSIMAGTHFPATGLRHGLMGSLASTILLQPWRIKLFLGHEVGAPCKTWASWHICLGSTASCPFCSWLLSYSLLSPTLMSSPLGNPLHIQTNRPFPLGYVPSPVSGSGLWDLACCCLVPRAPLEGTFHRTKYSNVESSISSKERWNIWSHS